MARINILDEVTINQLQAGEVVERPSSVVKELVENSIDAQSSKIIVEIEDGGKKLIRITDNGNGIESSEVEKSFLRHATSKIKQIDDLYDLYSLGFRGEALASIASVAKIEMITKHKDEPVGTKITVEGGKIISKEPIGTNNGTTIIARDLFFNTPVRQKFLKSTHAETINISDLINKLVIGNPKVSIKYINNKKTMLNSPGDGKLINTIRSIYGKDITENLIELNHESQFFKVSGYIGNNNVYRANKNLQHIYINKRYVKSKIILDAISEGYKSLIPINKHAVCFLNIEINPSKIDVNIHPTKLELKFENEQQIYVELKEYIRKSLIRSNLIGKYETYDNVEKRDLKKVNNLDNSLTHNKNQISSENINQGILNNLEKEYKSQTYTFEELDERKELEKKINTKDLNNKINKIDKDEIVLIDETIDLNKVYSFNDLVELEKKEENKSLKSNEDDTLNNKPIISESLIKESESVYTEKNEQVEFNNNDKNKFSLNEYIVIGTIFKTYIILQKGSHMYLLDQHAAHERVLFEKYMDKFYNMDINMQMLLDPIVLELATTDMLQVENNIDLFMKFGFEIEIFGKNHIMIRCVPTIFGTPESEKFVLDIIDNIDEIKNNYELKGEKFASMACKAAIKANDSIYDEEINSLLNQIEMCKNPFT
ncbi:DNA mismatch repair protein MutL [Paraclostridium bifermentans]|nr:DNA mismatch repair endonuclease MutL [Paraclostridium bifermentans]MDV8113720.1 DNA mismatch repair endonuclease MutL [Bacillus sp. BAU-SS-2023]EQK39115.1 DNA mismatch repair MutL family protein [[Clostridium] bifermentans ATCC 19299] [Paraclostridium bifermentans ATCC 19299]MCR1875782.1 DNA mismatch repair endonuclease MutL [Paraclostridium bifermentans]GKZ03376.1 DNA mismatch repair protein MutL [Paraclostridium bifermentans]GKZ06166.1 DNA mismatch repair protein MutL [Paraclostridium bi